MNQKLKKYIPLVDFIGTVCGENFEVILHDVTNVKESVVAVKNGYLSGRKVGDPMTDLSIQILKDKEYLSKPYIANYEGKLKNGKTFISATYFIKDGDELIGFLCINHDPSMLLALNAQVCRLMEAFHIPSEGGPTPYTEILDGSINDISNYLIHKVVSDFAVAPPRMTREEKAKVVEELERQKIFEAKGSVAKAAKELCISEPTLYRYLKQIRSHAEHSRKEGENR